MDSCEETLHESASSLLSDQKMDLSLPTIKNEITEEEEEDRDENDSSSSSRLSQSLASSSSYSALRTRSGRCVKYNSDYQEKYKQKQQRQNLFYQVKKALNKSDTERTQDDQDLLTNCKDLVQHAEICKQNRVLAAKHQEIHLDDQQSLEAKCLELANAINNSKCCVVYTGAGLSTSASIPDYRGPNGLWTMLERGVKVQLPDFALVEPTYSHMALNSLMKLGLVKHVVSQNCDGLHLRSGIDREKLSELHGNCFIEFCPECYAEYVRLFDVTEKTCFRKHSTGRYCQECVKETNKADEKPKGNQLRDSIIHFGEKLRNGMPYNWEVARDTVKEADLIVCLGTSLKVLKHYSCLWPKKKSAFQLYIVNIQWTPKDKFAKTKINGYCDQILEMVVKNLQKYHPKLSINKYAFKSDPIFKLAVKLKEDELNTTTKCILNSRMSQKERILQKTKSDTSLIASKNKLEGDADDDEVDESKPNDQASINANSWYSRSFKPRKVSNVKAEKKT